MEKQTIELKLDKAAYYLLKGAVLLQVSGKYGMNRFSIEVTPEMYAAIKEQPLVNYQKYMLKRKQLKEKCEKVNHIVRIKKGDFHKQKTKVAWGAA